MATLRRERPRQKKLLQLIEERCGGNKARFATEIMGWQPSEVSRFFTEGPNGRDISDDKAREIERKNGLPRFWMDDEGADGADQGVPVVGTAQLGDDGYWIEIDYPVGHGEGFITYPTRDKNAYALRVKGDSMRPRIKPGEFVVILPNHSIPPGEEVMVKTTDGRCMIKRLGTRRNGMVELISINETDHRPITLEETQVEKMHYVAAIVKDDLYRSTF